MSSSSSSIFGRRARASTATRRARPRPCPRCSAPCSLASLGGELNDLFGVSATRLRPLASPLASHLPWFPDPSVGRPPWSTPRRQQATSEALIFWWICVVLSWGAFFACTLPVRVDLGPLWFSLVPVLGSLSLGLWVPPWSSALLGHLWVLWSCVSEGSALALEITASLWFWGSLGSSGPVGLFWVLASLGSLVS